MAAIPKKYKKHIKSQYKDSDKKQSFKRTWAFNVGDLVEYKDICSIILTDRGDGWYQIMGPNGPTWAKGRELYVLQASTNIDKTDACKSEK